MPTVENCSEREVSFISFPVDFAAATSTPISLPVDFTAASTTSISLPVDFTAASTASISLPVNLTAAAATSISLPVDFTAAAATPISFPVNFAATTATTVALDEKTLKIYLTNNAHHQQLTNFRLLAGSACKYQQRFSTMSITKERQKKNVLVRPRQACRQR